ncbi:MAG: AraC family transcriptional regulator [Myxococcota bacterium]
MLTVPIDLAERDAHTVQVGAAACVVAYRSTTQSDSSATLVSAPTLVRVRRGTKVLRSPGDKAALTVRAGRTVIMPTGVRLMSELLADDGAYESTVISLDPGFLARAVPGLLGSRDGRGPTRSLLDPLPDLAARIDALPQVLAHASDARLLELGLEDLALRLARGPAEVRRILAHGVRVGHGDGPKRLRAVMEQHVHEPLQLEDFATLCGRSLASFKRDFRRLHGVAPGGWIAQERLAYATQRLADPNVSVTEACFSCGYGNLSSFIRAFKRRFGVSPKQWQRAHAARP